MIRILTYNIHKAIGNDRKFSLDRIIEFLKKCQADIICLQEVDYLVPRSKNEDLALIIAESLGYHYELGLNVYLKKGAYGNAIFSRFPIVHSENLNITWGIKKRRGCLMAKIITPLELLKNDLFYSEFKEKIQKSKKHIEDFSIKEIGILNMHLGLANFERLWQVEQILNSAFIEIMKNYPLVIVGDTNDRLERVDKLFEKKGFFDTTKLISLNKKIKKSQFYTFPSYSPQPIIRIDKIFINSYWEVIDHKVIKDKLTKIASDHYPIYVDLKLK
ncbi:MAG: hypothetical protein KatS3mg129_2884 [Leptospiraceae bacterium]|nr:MAG: hypothetical protein KatS3mg129_2884 [Leptospiraceae bacterium]